MLDANIADVRPNLIIPIRDLADILRVFAEILRRCLRKHSSLRMNNNINSSDNNDNHSSNSSNNDVLVVEVVVVAVVGIVAVVVRSSRK